MNVADSTFRVEGEETSSCIRAYTFSVLSGKAL